MRQIAYRLIAEDAGAGRIDARCNHIAHLDMIRVRQEVGRRRLRIARRRRAVRQRREILPHLRVVDLRRQPLRVIVRVDETWHNRLAGDVEYLRAFGNGHAAARAHSNNATVAHDDIGVLDDLFTLHRQCTTTAEDHHAFRQIARSADRHTRFHRFVARRRLLGGIGLRDRVRARNAVLHALGGIGTQQRLCLVVDLERIIDNLGAIEVVRPHRVAECPQDLATVAGPRWELAPDRVQLPHRHRCRGGLRHVHTRRRAADLRNSDRIEIHPDHRERLIAFGSHQYKTGRRCLWRRLEVVAKMRRAEHVAGEQAARERIAHAEPVADLGADRTRAAPTDVLTGASRNECRIEADRCVTVGATSARRQRACDAQMRLEIGAIPTERLQPAAAIREDACRVLREVRRSHPRRRHNGGDCPAVRRHPDKLGGRRAEERGAGFLHFTCCCAQADDAVRR